MADEVESGFSLANVLAIWNRRKWLAILAFVATFSSAATAIAVLPKIYQSTATILVVGQQVPTDFVRPTVTGSLDSRLQTISQEILSRSRLEALITKFNLYPSNSSTEQRVSSDVRLERVRRDIEVKPTGTDRSGLTVAFTVKYQGSDPQTVANVTNTLASYYIEENMKVRERQATGTADFLRIQLGQVKGRLESQEHHVSEFKRRNLGELPTQLDANLGTLERLNTQFRLNGEKQIRVREQRQELARLIDAMTSMASMASAQIASPGAKTQAPASPIVTTETGLTARLAKMKQELNDLRTRYNDRYPDVIQLKADIAALERQIAETKRATPPAESAAPAPDAPVKDEPIVQPRDPYLVQMEQSLSQLNVEINSLKEEENQLRAAMSTYQVRVDNTPRRDLEFQELSRDYDTTRELYRTLLKRYEEAQLSENLEQRQKGEQFQILEPAMASGTPVAPNRPRLMLLGLGLSLGLAVGLVIVAEQLDTSFHTVDELRAFTSFPVLASIPRIVTEGDGRRSRWRAVLATAVVVCCLTLLVGASYFVTRGNEELLRLVSGRP
jgi:polysaccharide chain length determinant protein (PEP-CTERM system associated)